MTPCRPLSRPRLQHAEPERRRHRGSGGGDRVVLEPSLLFDEALPHYGTRARRAAADAIPPSRTSSPLMWAEALDLMMARLAGERPRSRAGSPPSPARRSSTAASI